MNSARFISSRINFQGRLALVGVALSYLVMILALAISGGFRSELRKGISALAGDVQLTPSDMNYLSGTSSLPLKASYIASIDSLGYVKDVDGVVYRAGIARNGSDIQGVVFKGVPDGPDSLGVSIPTRLGSLLGLKVGDDLLSYFIGEKMRVRKFRIVDTYESPLGVDEGLVVFCSLGDLQRVNGWEDEVSAFEVHLSSSHQSEPLLTEALDEVGLIAYAKTPDDEPYPIARSSVQRYPQIFSWLSLIDFNVLFILLLMTVVAGFNMISGLLILLFRNISTIGVLKSLGMTDWKISEVFLRVASSIVLRGMLIGNLIALAFCLLQGRTHLFRLNPENYFLSFVPIHVDVGTLVFVDIASYIVIMVLLLIPSMFISKVDPAKTVRAQ